VRGPVAVTVLCPDEACLAAVASSVRVPRVGRARARTYTQRVVTRPLAKATRLTVRLTLSKRARVAIGRALRARKRVFVTVRVRVADSAGNVRSLTRRVALRR
jgi:hypothetical protein